MLVKRDEAICTRHKGSSVNTCVSQFLANHSYMFLTTTQLENTHLLHVINKMIHVKEELMHTFQCKWRQEKP